MMTRHHPTPTTHHPERTTMITQSSVSRDIQRLRRNIRETRRRLDAAEIDYIQGSQLVARLNTALASLLRAAAQLPSEQDEQAMEFRHAFTKVIERLRPPERKSHGRGPHDRKPHDRKPHDRKPHDHSHVQPNRHTGHSHHSNHSHHGSRVTIPTSDRS